MHDSNRKVVKFHKVPTVNIVVIVFLLVFIFFVVTQVVRAMNQTHVSIFEVKKSYVDTNISGEAMALRQEKVFQAETSGYVNYYIRSGQKVGNQAMIYTVDSTGALSDLLMDMSAGGTTLNTAGYTEIRDSMTNFENYFSDVSFSDVYDFKNDLQGQILDVANTQLLSELSASGQASAFSQVLTSESGVVSFYQDGYETKTPGELTSADFNKDNYNKVSLRTGDLVQAGSPVYKLVTSEYWNLVLPLTAEEANRLREDTRVTLKMPNVPHEVYADLAILEHDGEAFANITLDKRMVNYCDSRYVPIEIVMTKSEGLTIPNTAILSKSLGKLPRSYLTEGDNQMTDSYGFNVKILDENGKESVEFVSPPIYYSDKDYVYIDKGDFTENAVIVKPNSTETLSVGQASMQEFPGVYCANRGITEFRIIEKLATSGDFTIIADNLDYSLKQYDHIILDATTVENGQIIH